MRQGVVLCVAWLALAAPGMAGQRDPAVAGVLGLVPGFGTGYWYADHHQGKATTFTVLDASLTAGFALGADQFADHLFSSKADGWATFAGVCFYARIGSAIYQCVDGIATVNSDNRRGTRLTGSSRPPKFGWQVGFSDFAGVPNSALAAEAWSRRFELGNQALGYSRAVDLQPPVMLSLNTAHLGATLSFHQQF